jgi:hypothetical protein
VESGLEKDQRAMETVRYRHRDYPRQEGRFAIMQEYYSRPYLFFIAVYGMMLLFLLSQHRSMLWPGVIGAFTVVILGNYLGLLFAKGRYLEIGFMGEFFYMRSAYDIAHGTDRKLYPLSYAHPTRTGGDIVLNYIEHSVKIRPHEWDNWNEIWYALHNPPQPPLSVMYPFSSTF